MKSLIALFLVTSFTILSQAQEDSYYEIKKVTVMEIADSELPPIDMKQVSASFADCNKNQARINSGDLADPIKAIGVVIDEIINVGKKVWTVIEAGRPVVNVKLDSASALPKGLYCWTDLTNWRPTDSKAYKISYQNGFGMTVVDFAFRALYTSGGSYEGQGQYLANATIVPARLNVNWGFTFNAKTEVPMVFNQGTKEAPVAGMQLNVKWSVDSVMSHAEQAEAFFVGGDGAFKHLN